MFRKASRPPHSSHRKTLHRKSLYLETLEVRAMLAADANELTFPLDTTKVNVQVFSTYMQYQGAPPNENSKSIIGLELHEGLDLVAAAGSVVSSVSKGVVVKVHKPAKGPDKDHFIVIRDVDGNNTKLDSGWNYKHVIPIVKEGDEVKAGQPIGRIAPFPAPIPAHLHIDRGIGASITPSDPTMANLTKSSSADVRAALAKQLAPVKNPLLELRKSIPDELPPKIESLSFKVANDDQWNSSWSPGIGLAAGDRAVSGSKASRYFEETLDVHVQEKQVPHSHIGNRARSRALADQKSVTQNELKNGQIDFVVEAHDRTGSPQNPGQFALAPLRFGFQIERTSPAKAPSEVTKHEFVSFDFSDWREQHAKKNVVGIANFYSSANTQVVYTLDEGRKTLFNQASGDTKKRDHRLFFNLTNSRNLQRYEVKDGKVFLKSSGKEASPTSQPVEPRGGWIHGLPDKQLHWNSMAAVGSEHFPELSKGKLATSNAQAAYADGIYKFTIWATDAHGNRGSKDFPVILTNWERTIEFAKPVPKQPKVKVVGGGGVEVVAAPEAPEPPKTIVQSGEKIQIAGGSGYRAHQKLDVYLVPAGDGKKLDNTLARTKIGQLETDADGKIKAGDLQPDPEVKWQGRHFLFVDYNGDGQYTPYLDSSGEVEFQQAPAAAKDPSTVNTLDPPTDLEDVNDHSEDLLPVEPITTTNHLEPDSIPPTDFVWFFAYEEYVAEVASPPDLTPLDPITSPESDVLFEAWAMEDEVAYLQYLNSSRLIDPATSDDLSDNSIDEGASHLEDFIVPLASDDNDELQTLVFDEWSLEWDLGYPTEPDLPVLADLVFDMDLAT